MVWCMLHFHRVPQTETKPDSTSPCPQINREGISTAMQVTAEQTDPCTIVLDIVVDEPQVSRAFDSVYREFSRQANVPGFRPWKAPIALVDRYVDAATTRERSMHKF